jgi:hypothetical protein
LSEIRIIGPDGQRFVFPAGTDPEVMKSAMRRRYTGETRRTTEMIRNTQLPDERMQGARDYLARDQLRQDMEAGRQARRTEEATGPENIAKERFYTGAQGRTLGAAPLIQGAINIPISAMMYPFLTQEQKAGRSFDEFVSDMSSAGYDQARGSIDRAREKRPLESLGLEIAGGFIAGKTAYDDLGNRFLASQPGARGALVGAGSGAQYEFLESEGDPLAAGRGALIGAPVGAGVSKAMEAAAEPLGRLFRGEVPVPKIGPEATNAAYGAGLGGIAPADSAEERAQNMVVGAGIGLAPGVINRVRGAGAPRAMPDTMPAGAGDNPYFGRQSMRPLGSGPSPREIETQQQWAKATPIVTQARTTAQSAQQAADAALQSKAPADIARAKDQKKALVGQIKEAQASRAGMDTPEDARLAETLASLSENTSDPVLLSTQISAAKTSLDRLLTDIGSPSEGNLIPVRTNILTRTQAPRSAAEGPQDRASVTRYAEGEVPPIKGMGFGASKPPKPAPLFYSTLSRFVENSKVAKASPAEWKKLLVQPAHTVRSAQRDPATNRVVLGDDGKPIMLERAVPEVFPPNVTPEEIEFTGVMDWLDLQTGPVSREDVANYVRQNGVTVEEVVKQASATQNPPSVESVARQLFDESWDNPDNWNDWMFQSRKDRAEELFQAQPVDVREMYTYNGQPDAMDWAQNEAGSRRYLDQFLFSPEEIRDIREAAWLDSRWDYEASAERQIAQQRQYGELEGEGDTKWMAHTLPGGENYTEVLLTLPARPGQAGYKPAGSHWDDPNVIAHTRFKDRQGPQGQRVLALEEIQSDWHQIGRERGYTPKETPQSAKQEQDMRQQFDELKSQARPLQAEEDQLRLSMGKLLFESGYTSRLPATSNDVRLPPSRYNVPERAREAYEELDKRRTEVINKIMELRKRGDSLRIKIDNLERERSRGVPDAPFKQTSSWTSLVLNRMIRKAADEGYDGVAWIPGDIQNGKRVSADDDRSDFYDKIVVNAANKIGKKYGARVEKMPGLAVDENGKAVDFYYLSLTPDMKAKAQQEGFPLFAAAPFAAVGGVGAGTAMGEDD